MKQELGKETFMNKVTVLDCLVLYYMDYLEVVIENGLITGFLYREKEE